MSKTNASKLPAATTVIALACFAVALGGTSAAAASSATPAASSVLSIFAQPQTSVDQIPLDEGQPYGDGAGLNYDSSRHLGETDKAEFWTLTADDGSICVAALLKDSRSMTFVCKNAESFAETGLSGMALAGTEDSDGYTEFYYAPDSAALRSNSARLDSLAPNLLVGDTRGSKGTVDLHNYNKGLVAEGAPLFEIPLLHPDVPK